MRFALLLLLLISGTVASAQAQPQTLPDDRSQYSFVVVHEDQPSATTHRLSQMFASDPQLAQLARSFTVHRFPASDALYRKRYASALPPNDLPALALVRPDGGVVYKASGTSIPATSQELYADLVYYANLDLSLRTGGGQSWDARTQCPDGNCPNVAPPQPWRQPFQPDGALRPDTWIPDSIDLRPQVNVDLGGELIVWVGVGVMLLIFLVCGAGGLVLLLRD